MAIVRAQEASSSTCVYSYDVFLSFRGEDTRKNFTDHLYTALVREGYRTFRDNEEVERGKSLGPELVKAIKESRISIIVFSKDYASSPWCLDEVVMILKCRSTSGHVVLPVFYDIHPSEIRKQTGRTKKAFDGYIQQSEAEIDIVKKMKLTEKIKGWKEAFQEVADLAGMDLRNQADGHESKFIEQIIKVIGNKLSPVALDVGPYEIGIDSRAREINMWLQDGSSEVGSLGICGVGGIGKTTITKYVYNQNCKRFDGSSFLANIREMSAEPNGLVGLQKQLLSDVLKREKEEINNVSEGTTKIKKALSKIRVLLVFDDVDDIDQLYAVRGMQDQLFPGSKIIITTRNQNLLKPHEVYMVKELGYHESLTLFSLHAFGKECPPESYKEQAERVIQLCGGLPLALQVLGSSLSRKSVDRWINEVKKLQEIPHHNILEKLKISYESLQDDHDKRLFLHIACFFVGEDKDEIVKLLENCDLHAAVGIENLTDRCLLTIDSPNKLRMHQLIQDMGKEIVRQESPDEPGKRSRLWLPEQSFNVLKNKTGTKKIEGLTLDTRMLKDDVTKLEKRKHRELEKSTLSSLATSLKRRCLSLLFWQSIRNTPTSPTEVELSTDAFEKMKKLRLLKLNYVHLSGLYESFPKNLRWLCWHGFPLNSVPTEFSLKNLVVLDMSYSKLKEVWKGFKFLGSLKILNLSYSEGLQTTPNLSGCCYLERLILKGCASLVKICVSIELLEELVLLDLECCESLRTLPINIHSLKTLIISGCFNLVELPTNLKNMPSLQVLCADGIDINSLSVSTMQEKSRQRISRKTFVTSLPSTMVELSLAYCRLYEDSFPSSFSNLTSLKKLDISGNLFGTFPDGVKSLRNLKILTISSCRKLQSIQGLPISLEKVDLDFCRSVKKVSFQSTETCIAVFRTFHCGDLYEIEGFFKIEPIGKVDAKIIKSMGIDIESMENIGVQLEALHTARVMPIQGLHEFGIFNTFIPGVMIPSCFVDKSKGSSISFTVSSLPNPWIRCLNVFCVYSTDMLHIIEYPTLLAKIHNRTKNLTWFYSPICWGSPRKRGVDTTWLSQWNFGNQLEVGDEVTVSISTTGSFKVKECGINIVYEEEEQEEENNEEHNDKHHGSTLFFGNEVIGGDLSNFLLSTGSYLLCRFAMRRDLVYYLNSLLKSLGEFIDDEEITKFKVRCRLRFSPDYDKDYYDSRCSSFVPMLFRIMLNI